MSGNSRVFRNIFWLGCATGGSLITSLIYGLLAARHLGPADFGRFSLIVGMSALMSNLAQGAGTSVLTVLAAQRHCSVGSLMLPGILSQALVGTACVVLSVPLVVILGGDPTLFAPSVIYCVGSVSLLIYSAPIAIFRGLNRMHWSIAQTAAGLLTIASVWIVIRRGASLSEIITASALAQVAVLFVVLILSLRVVPSDSRWRMPRALVSEILRKTMGLSGVTVFQSVHWKVGLIMVQLLGGAYALGIYTAGAKPIENLRTVPLVFLLSIFPSISQMVSENPKSLQRALVSVTRVVLLFMLPIVGALVALSPVVIRFLYGSEYTSASGILSLSLLAVIPGTVHLIFIMPLVAGHEIKKLSVVYSAAILIETAIDLVLYSRIGLPAAVAGAITGALVTAILADMNAFPGASVLRDRRVLKLLAAGTVSLAIPFTGILETHRWLLCTVTILVFLVVARVSGSFTFAELRNLQSLRAVASPSPGTDLLAVVDVEP
jgi:O-antigen/teichoic acid export membrane protein